MGSGTFLTYSSAGQISNTFFIGDKNKNLILAVSRTTARVTKKIPWRLLLSNPLGCYDQCKIPSPALAVLLEFYKSTVEVCWCFKLTASTKALKIKIHCLQCKKQNKEQPIKPAVRAWFSCSVFDLWSLRNKGKQRLDCDYKSTESVLDVTSSAQNNLECWKVVSEAAFPRWGSMSQQEWRRTHPKS